MDSSKKIIVYDGSFQGFLSAVYRIYEEKIQVGDIRSRKQRQRSLFGDTVEVPTDSVKARRVWDAIEKKHYKAVKSVYFAFLSEQRGVEMLLFRYLHGLFARQEESKKPEHVSLFSKLETLADAVAQEKRRMEIALRRYAAAGTMEIAVLSPHYNVLPLLTRHFRSLYGDRQWVLYDSRRQYGLFYNLSRVTLLPMSPDEITLLLRASGKEGIPHSGETGSLSEMSGNQLNTQSAKRRNLSVKAA